MQILLNCAFSMAFETLKSGLMTIKKDLRGISRSLRVAAGKLSVLQKVLVLVAFIL